MTIREAKKKKKKQGRKEGRPQQCNKAHEKSLGGVDTTKDEKIEVVEGEKSPVEQLSQARKEGNEDEEKEERETYRCAVSRGLSCRPRR